EGRRAGREEKQVHVLLCEERRRVGGGGAGGFACRERRKSKEGRRNRPPNLGRPDLTKRSVALVFAFAGAVGLLILRQSVTQAQITNPQPTPAANELQSITLVFGSKDMEPAKWDGSPSISNDSI